jgi:hypothetical protein
VFDDEEDANVSDRYYRNDVFSILGNQRIVRSLEFETTARGVFSINELQISSRDLFLKHPFAYIAGNETKLYVLPKRIPMAECVDIRNSIMGDYEVRRWDNPDPFAFRGIRPYQSYDTMHSINWKATAGKGELMVNQYQATTESEVRIYLNLKPYMKSQADLLAEHSISIVSTIAADCIAHGINVGFYTNGVDIDNRTADSSFDEKSYKIVNPYLEAAGGKLHLKALDMMLARLDISAKTSDMLDVLKRGFSGNEHHVTHVLISSYRDDALYEFFEEHLSGNSFFWIVPARDGDTVKLRYPGMFRWDTR